MAADSPLTDSLSRAGLPSANPLSRPRDLRPPPAEAPCASRPSSLVELFVQDLPPFPSLAALRALTDHDLPSTDGVPMPESMWQIKPMTYSLWALGRWYRTRRPGTCVAVDLLVYSEGRPEADGRVRPVTVAPDVLVAFGVGERMRDSYVMWQEGKAPDFVMEVASGSTWKRDRDEKPGLYASLGVGEYFLFDVQGGLLEPRLQGYELREGRYRPLREERLANGEWGVRSRVLGLCAYLWGPERKLRWHDPESGRDLEDPDEVHDSRDAEVAARKAAEDRADREAAARKVAEEEVAELRARIRRLQHGSET